MIDPALADLDRRAHRPWPLPSTRWIMRQTWHDLLFAHWPLAADQLRELIPAPFEVDVFAGRAWIAVVPFRMSGIRRRGWPRLPFHSSLPELNVRTYVRIGDRPGVCFFSLDAGNRLAVWAARRFFHLPYFLARMSATSNNNRIDYHSERIHRGAPPTHLDVSYGPREPIAEAKPASLEHFLTERYCLYTTDPAGNAWCGQIHHRPWPLQIAHAHFKHNTMAAPLGIKLAGEPLLHFASRLDVVVWPLVRC